MHAVLEYRGSFRFVDHRALERAIGEAAEHVEDDAIADVDREWLRFLSRRGTTVRVDAVMPATADRHVAAAVIGALARRAIEGCVDVTSGEAVLDAFASEG